mmetsp:Transcript_38995/g.76656  ORF Transcript_38995/g.76656 Transcript_38995/m.76656 type:complete len:94 (-) Transcript_38995:1349-1630(-)
MHKPPKNGRPMPLFSTAIRFTDHRSKYMSSNTDAHTDMQNGEKPHPQRQSKPQKCEEKASKQLLIHCQAERKTEKQRVSKENEQTDRQNPATA